MFNKAARFPILVLTGLLAAGLDPAPHAAQKGIRKVDTYADSLPDAQCPFALSLAASDGPGLRLSIRNLTSKPQAYLHDPALQPSLLLIRGPDGKRVAPHDDRKIKKQNTTPEPEDYPTLSAGATDTLYAAVFAHEAEGYALKWGPFSYRGLAPGKYEVRAEWRSIQDAWRDSETGKRGRVPDLWKGKAESNEVIVTLP